MRKQGGFWCSAQAASKFRFSGGVTAHPGCPALPRSSCFTFPSPSGDGEAQAGCGQQVLCVGNRRPACCRAWCSAWHCPKLPGRHWSLPGGAGKGCSAFASGAGSSFSGGGSLLPVPSARWNGCLVTFQQFRNAERGDAVLSMPVLHTRTFPLVSSLPGRRKLCCGDRKQGC